MLRKVFVVHALVTFAAAVALVVSPNLIPGTVGARLEPGAFIVCYLLAAAELAVAFLSFNARKLEDAAAVRLVCWTFIVFHLSTAGLEVYAWAQGLSPFIFANVAVRLVVSAVFAALGLRRPVR